MSKTSKSSIAVDVNQEKTILNALPFAPTISSAAKGWDGIYVAYHRQPSWQTPELSFKQHSIMIYTGQPVAGERYLEGRFLEGSYTFGKVGIHPAQMPQKIYWADKVEFIQICIAPSQLANYINQEFDYRYGTLSPQFAIDDALVYGIGLALKAELENNYPNTLYIQSATTLLCLHLHQHYGIIQAANHQYTGGFPPSQLRYILDYIHEHFNSDLSLVELAALVELSPNYFVQLFKQSTGVSPYQYVLNYRINKAKQLLKSNLSIAQISQQVGFFDQSRFTKIFRKRTGLTPKQYRNQL